MATHYSDILTSPRAKPYRSISNKLANEDTIIAKFAATGALALNDIVHMVKLKRHDVIESLRFANDDMGTTGDISIGTYSYNHRDDTFTVIDLDEFAADLDVNAAAVGLTDRRYSVFGIETAGQPLWQLAGYASEDVAPLDIYVSLTVSEATTAAGDLVLEVKLA